MAVDIMELVHACLLWRWHSFGSVTTVLVDYHLTVGVFTRLIVCCCHLAISSASSYYYRAAGSSRSSHDEYAWKYVSCWTSLSARMRRPTRWNIPAWVRDIWGFEAHSTELFVSGCAVIPRRFALPKDIPIETRLNPVVYIKAGCRYGITHSCAINWFEHVLVVVWLLVMRHVRSNEANSHISTELRASNSVPRLPPAHHSHPPSNSLSHSKLKTHLFYKSFPP